MSKNSYSKVDGENVRLLQALIDEAPSYTKPTNSRNANILKSIINNTEYNEPPQSEIEELLIALKAKIGGEIEVNELTVTENGSYDAGLNKAYNPVNVELPLDSKEITANGTYKASDDNLAGFSQVDVHVSGYKITDVSGLPSDIATFTDGANLPMPSLKVSIEPIQEGSGDPSPSNVRPISGWDEVNVGVEGGQNLYNDGIVWKNNYYINASGDETQSNNYKYTQTFIEVEPSTTYSIQADIIALTDLAITVPYYSEQQSFISRDLVINVDIGTHTYKVDFTTPSNCKYIRISVPTDTTNIVIYKKKTYTIDLDGTRYGGVLDVVSGTMTVDRAIIDLGTLTYTYDAIYNRFASSAISNLKRVDVRTLHMQSSCYKCVWHNESIGNVPDASFYNSSNETNIYIHDSRYTDATAFKTALAGQTVCYPLATPLTIQLSPTPVISLNGVNNVLAITGDVVEASYFESL